MNITKFAIERNRASLTLVLFFLIGGLIAFFEMPRAKDPEFIIRTAVVNTFFPGATPDRVASLVTDPLEKHIKQLEEIKFVSSVSSKGVSTIYVNIEDRYKDMQPIWQELQKKIDDAARELPPEAGKPFINDSYSEVYGTIVTLVGEGFSYAELEQVAQDVREDFMRIEDVGKVELLGLQQQKIYVEFSNAKLAEVGLSPAALGDIIRKRNIITPGGAITYGPQRLSIEPTGNLRSIEELGKTIIPIPGTQNVVYLEDITTIKQGYSDPRDPIVKAGKEGAIAIAISVKKGGNILELGKELKEHINKLQTQYPIGIEFALSFDEPELVAYIIDNFLGSLVMAVAIVIAVMFGTLGWRTALIVSALIPSTILVSFFVMNLMHISLHQVSLAALIIALGLLVDNAIVITEAVLVRMSEGESAMNAAILSAKELSISLLTSSLTTAAAFLPIYLAESSASEYIASLFQVVTITLLSSWFLSMTLTPLMCYALLKPEAEYTYDNFVCSSFKKMLESSLKWRYTTMGIIFIMFLFSLYMFTEIPKSFFPSAEQPSALVSFTMPEGSSIDRTYDAIKPLEAFIEERRGTLLTNYTTFIGKGAPRFWVNYSPHPKADNYAEILINAPSNDELQLLLPQITEFARNHYSDAKVNVKKLDNGPPQESPLQVRLSGKDEKKLYEITKALKVKMIELGGVVDATDDWGIWTENLVINIKPALAYHAGVSYSDVARSLRTALTGDQVTQFRGDQKTIPIILRSRHSLHDDFNTLRSTLVFVPSTGKSVPLTQVADIEMVWKAPKLIRRDGVYTVTVSGELANGATSFDMVKALKPWLEHYKWPQGYRYEIGGEVESSKKATEAIQKKLPISLMIILLIIMMQFNSFKNTGLILTTIPLGIIGVVFGLVVTDTPFGFMSYLGVISLIGIVINNAIILIERIELEMTRLTPQDAILEAAQRRMRPILLTTATTIGGLIPLWIGGGPMWQPMAISIIFGLGFSTILTLGVIPLLYAIFNNITYDDDYHFQSEGSCALR